MLVGQFTGKIFKLAGHAGRMAIFPGGVRRAEGRGRRCHSSLAPAPLVSYNASLQSLILYMDIARFSLRRRVHARI